MWLLGVVGAAAGIVAAIYVYGVLSSGLRDRLRDSRHHELSRRAKDLTRQWNEEQQNKGTDAQGP